MTTPNWRFWSWWTTQRPKTTDSLKRKRARKILEAQEKAEAKAAFEEAPAEEASAEEPAAAEEEKKED